MSLWDSTLGFTVARLLAVVAKLNWRGALGCPVSKFATFEASLMWAQKIATYDSVALRFAKQVLSSTTSNKKASLLQAKALEGILYHRRQ